MIVSTLSVFRSGSNSTRLFRQGIAGHTVEIVDVSCMEKPWDKSSRSIMFRTPPGFGVGDAWGVGDVEGVWLVAGAVSATATRTMTMVENSAPRTRDMGTSPKNWAHRSLRENPGADKPVSADRRLQQAQEKVDRVEQPAGESSYDRAVDADVLKVVAGMLLDESHRALGAEGAHAVLDELGEPLVVPLDRLDHAPLHPRIELPPEVLVPGQRPARTFEPLHDPDADFGPRPLEVGEQRPVQRRRRVLEDARRDRRRQQVALRRLDARGEARIRT